MLAFATLPRLKKRVLWRHRRKKCHVSFVISAIHLSLFEFVIQDPLRDLKRYTYKTKHNFVGSTRHSQTINEWRGEFLRRKKTWHCVVCSLFLSPLRETCQTRKWPRSPSFLASLDARARAYCPTKSEEKERLVVVYVVRGKILKNIFFFNWELDKS